MDKSEVLCIRGAQQVAAVITREKINGGTREIRSMRCPGNVSAIWKMDRTVSNEYLVKRSR